MERVVMGTTLTYCDFCDSRNGTDGYDPFEGNAENALASGWIETDTGIQCPVCFEKEAEHQAELEQAGIVEETSVGAIDVANLAEIDPNVAGAIVPEGKVLRQKTLLKPDGTRELISNSYREEKPVK